jgi:hypothetical protein
MSFSRSSADAHIRAHDDHLGNVSYVCPSFHSGFAIDTQPGAFNHTAGFTAAAGTEDAYRKAIGSAKGMALAAWKVLVDEELAKQVREAFEADAAIQQAIAEL